MTWRRLAVYPSVLKAWWVHCEFSAVRALNLLRLLVLRFIHAVRESVVYCIYKIFTTPSLENSGDNLIVGLTSFPARINHVWITIESLMRQTKQPDRIVLVLCIQEFPGKALPMSLERLQARGLEILWVEENTRGLKKLAPLRQLFPNASIVTVDDDGIYRRWLLAFLVSCSRIYVNSVVGCRGWEIVFDGSQARPYREWKVADLDSDPSRTVLTNGSGTIFPPGMPDSSWLLDTSGFQTLCPLADDIWIWAASRWGGFPTVCCRAPSRQPFVLFSRGPKLRLENVVEGGNDRQFRAVWAELMHRSEKET